MAPEPTWATTTPSISTSSTPSSSEELVTRLPLFDERLAARNAAADKLRALAENRGGQRPLELGLDGGRKGRRLEVAPRSAFLELEVERAEDVDQPAVDPV
ncbi:MAG: hypothetical protein ACTHNB_06260 [Gaiellaceae bacterium]